MVVCGGGGSRDNTAPVSVQLASAAWRKRDSISAMRFIGYFVLKCKYKTKNQTEHAYALAADVAFLTQTFESVMSPVVLRYHAETCRTAVHRVVLGKEGK